MATTDSITRRFAVACGLLGQYAAMTATQPTPASSSAGVPASVQPGTVVQDGSAHNAQQLTIFYGGMVVVVDNCTPAKAAELIRLAGAAARKGAPHLAPTLVNTPVARKESLRRFLSKRKYKGPDTTPVDPDPDSDPVPYERQDQEPEPAAKRGRSGLNLSREEAATWLRLGSLASMHARCLGSMQRAG